MPLREELLANETIKVQDLSDLSAGTPPMVQTRQIIEKPKGASKYLINAGVYVQGPQDMVVYNDKTERKHI